MSVNEPDRTRLNSAELEVNGWDGVVCASPEEVLLATGYWPVIGNALAVMKRDGSTGAIRQHRPTRGTWRDSVVLLQQDSHVLTICEIGSP